MNSILNVTDLDVVENMPELITGTGVKVLAVIVPPAKGTSLMYKTALTIPEVVTRRAVKLT